MALSSVDFPQPEAPRATTKARSGMSSETRSSACTVRPSRAEKKMLALSTRSMPYRLLFQEQWSVANVWRRFDRRDGLGSGLLDPRHSVRRHERGVGRQHLGDLLLILEEDCRVLEDLGEPGLLAAAKPLIGELRVDRQQGEIFECARLVLRRAAEQFSERLGVAAVGAPCSFIGRE